MEDGGHSFWSLAVTYALSRAKDSGRSERAEYKPKVDYREVLDPIEFDQYNVLRILRNQLAEEAKVPPYNIFNNAQLVAIVRERPQSLEDLQRIEGVGEKKAENYGRTFLDRMTSLVSGDETDGAEDGFSLQPEDESP